MASTVRKHKKGRKPGRKPAPLAGPAAAATGRRSWFNPPPVLDALLMRIPWYAQRRAAQFSRREVLAAVPTRNDVIEWEVREPEEDSRDTMPLVVLRVPRRQDRWGKMLNRFFEGPPFRQVVLDELGTDVWLACDGENSIEDLIRILAQKHKLERREVEISLTMYLKTLAKRGFLGLRLE